MPCHFVPDHAMPIRYAEVKEQERSKIQKHARATQQTKTYEPCQRSINSEKWALLQLLDAPNFPPLAEHPLNLPKDNTDKLPVIVSHQDYILGRGVPLM